MDGWTQEPRAFDAVKGLDADAEWLLDPNAGQPLFQRRPGGNLAALAGAALRQAAKDTPFAFLLSPVEGGPSGEELLKELDAVATALKGRSADFRLNVSEADRERLKDEGTAGALCDQTFFDAAAMSRFAGMDKAMRLSSALRPAATPTDPPPKKPSAADPPAKRLSFPDRRFRRKLKTLADDLGKAFAAPEVVLGVIDDDFAVAHPRLRIEDGRTRLASYWDQEANFDETGSTVPFGRELTKTALDQLLGAWGEKPLPAFYAQPALAPFYPIRRNHLPRNASHGTHVLDLLAGAEPGEADDRPVVAVKLPRSSVLDTSGAHLEFFLLQAVHHIVERAAMLFGDADPAKSQPKVVIVASYGFFGGPLDGASQFERALDAVIAAHAGRVQIVLPSGNGRLVRAHAVMAAPTQTKPTELSWRVPSGDRTPSVMEIWSEPIAGHAAQVALEIVTPDGRVSPPLDDVDTAQKLVLTDNGKIVAEAVCARPPLHPDRRVFLVWLGPTADPPPDVKDVALAPAGVWTVRLTRIGGGDLKPYGVWIRRDDSLPGYPRLGLQSSVERGPPVEIAPPLDKDEAEEDLPADHATRAGTISKIATGGLTVVVGGFSLADLRAAAASAGGPMAPPPAGLPNPPPECPGWREGPDCMVPSQVSPFRGVKAANFFGGARVGYRGTSAAAPQLGRALADALATTPAGKAFDGRLTAAARAECFEKGLRTGSFRNRPYKDWRPPAARGGAGRFVDDAAMDTVFARDAPPWR